VIFGKYMQVDSYDNLTTCIARHDLPPSLGFGGPEIKGYAELPGYDFVVTFGWFHDNATNPHCSFFDFQTGGNLPCWPAPDYEWATIFMHELGHNLGLFHGGDGTGCCGEYQTDDMKPNYVSIMNDLYSNGTPIITASTTTGSGYFYRVDYSDETLASLDERNLDEVAGVGPTLHPTDYISWCCQLSGFASASGPIDWNGNGVATDTGLAGDLNNDGSLSVLTGFNDWAEVHEYLADEDQHPKHAELATS
jgi:hypothetical protein